MDGTVLPCLLEVRDVPWLHLLRVAHAYAHETDRHSWLQVFGADSILNVGAPETDVSRQQWLEDMDIDVSSWTTACDLRLSMLQAMYDISLLPNKLLDRPARGDDYV